MGGEEENEEGGRGTEGEERGKGVEREEGEGWWK